MNSTVSKIGPYLNYVKTFMCDLSSDVNNTPKTNAKSVKESIRN